MVPMVKASFPVGFLAPKPLKPHFGLRARTSHVLAALFFGKERDVLPWTSSIEASERGVPGHLVKSLDGIDRYHYIMIVYIYNYVTIYMITYNMMKVSKKK